MIPAIPTTIQERMDAFCQHFDVAPCKLSYVRRATDSIRMTDELMHWHEEHGASIDWICVGDPQPMMSAYRKARLAEKRFSKSVRALKEPEAAALFFVMKAVLAEQVTMDEALQVFTKAREQEGVIPPL